MKQATIARIGGQDNIIHGLFRPSPLASAIKAIGARFGAWHSRRVAVRELRAMPDSLLRDIGIERGQIKAAVYKRTSRPAVFTLRDEIATAPQQVAIQKAA